MFCHLQPLIRFQECFRPPANCPPMVLYRSPRRKSPPVTGRGKQGVGTKYYGDVPPGKCWQAEKEGGMITHAGLCCSCISLPGYLLPSAKHPCVPTAGCAAAVVAGGLTAWLGLALFALYLHQQLDKKNVIFPPAHLHSHLLLCSLTWELKHITHSPPLLETMKYYGGRLW